MTNLTWKQGTQTIKIENLSQLLDILVKIPLENVNREVTTNIIQGDFLEWLDSLPNTLILKTKISKFVTEYTPQQLREFLIRELRSKKA